MIRRTLLLLSLFAFIVSVGLWFVAARHPFSLHWSPSTGSSNHIYLRNSTIAITHVRAKTRQMETTNYLASYLWATSSNIEAQAPAWFICILFALYPPGDFTFTYLRRLRRRRRGRCIKCGYNLTGNVTGVCSECGCTVSIKS